MITPAAGYQIDPNNSNGVIPLQQSIAQMSGIVPSTPLNVPPPSSNVINPSIMGTSPIVIPPLTQPNYPAALATLPTALDQANQNVAQLQQQNNPYQTQEDSLQNQLLTSMQKLTGKTQFQTQAQDTAANQLGSTNGLSGFNSQLNDVNNQINGLQKEALAIPLQLQQQALGRGVTTGGLAPEQTGQLRNNTIKALGLSAIAQTIQGNIATAKDTAQRAVDLEFGDEQSKIDYLKTALTANEQNMSAADKKQATALQIQLDQRQQLLDQQKDDKNLIYAWAAEAAKNGANSVLINQALASNDPNTALGVLSPYFQDPNANAKALADLEQTRAQTQLIKANTGKVNQDITDARAASTAANSPVNGGQYTTALNTILGSGKFTKDQAAAVKNAINNGEDPVTVIKNQAKNLLNSTESTKLTSYESADKAMVDLKDALNSYYNGGGDTGILSGTMEQTYNKLGQVNDPKKVALATQVAVSLQAYRNAISGTAYSNQEGQQINTIFPGINKSHGLNDAVITGRLAADKSIIDGLYETALGKKTYQDLINPTTSSTSGAGPISPALTAAAKAKNFDIQGALNAGYTLSDIQDYLK